MVSRQDLRGCSKRMNMLTYLSIGPIFSLNMAGQSVIVLNTHKVAEDLLG